MWGRKQREREREHTEFLEAVGRGTRVIDDKAAEFRQQAPTAYPDGTPFPFHDLVDRLCILAKGLLAEGEPERAQFVIVMMASVATAAGGAGPEEVFHVNVVSMREFFLARGDPKDERLISEARLALLEFWGQREVL